MVKPIPIPFQDRTVRESTKAPAMNSEQFCENGRKMVEYISTYLEKIRERRVVHNVAPGYMQQLIPAEAPQEPEDFAEVFKDIDKIIMPGVTHWHSPRFHGYFAAGNSYPSILGDMLSDAIGCIGFSWASSPACTELEVITTDWLGSMLALPEEFLHRSTGRGGGVIQVGHGREPINTYPQLDEMEIMAKLVGYTSDQSNSSVGRSGLLGAVRMRKLNTDSKFSLRGEALKVAIEEDKSKGLIPFFLCATLGTTGTCAFDNLEELGPICKEEDMWLHIDAAYAGSAFVCPEFRHFMKGVEHADTFSINPHKWMLVNFDLSVMWIKDSSLLVDAFNVDPIYLRHENAGKGAPDYRHWQIPLGRRFRSLKLWFMLRSYGVTGVQAYIRKHVHLAKEFEQMLLNDTRFEVVGDVIMGLVCFRLKGSNSRTERLLQEILQDGRIYLIPAIVHNIYTLRLAICAERTNLDDIAFSFSVIRSCSDRVTKEFQATDGTRQAVTQQTRNVGLD
ncbi:aromatic-L-amino-acid decarboxylase-like [Pecten maximus]|uniref:aromatic-L-amino-acid decarboxylase-like n=1 Tax=Pecten maximus TaxID=6579 RepID=UPI001458E249|nr:aromatic-L-amino-acid decarboxylase-like [Pecten maximus]